MTREIDKRNHGIDRTSRERTHELQTRASTAITNLREKIRTLRIEKLDSFTGNPSLVVSESTEKQSGNYVQRALNFVQNISTVLGLDQTQQAPEFVADPNPKEISSGAVAVYLQQQYKGIPVFQAAQTVRFDPEGTLRETAGTSITISQDIDVSPKISVEDAVLKAAEFVASPQPDEEERRDQFGEPLRFTHVDISNFVPKTTAVFLEKPERPTVLEAGPFGDEFKARLIWFQLDNDNTRLAWEVIVTLPNYEGQYRVLVDTDNGEILYSHQLIRQIAAIGNVFLVDGGGTRQNVNFPRSLQKYLLPIPQDLPQGYPDTWVAINGTVGNCVRAHLNNGGIFEGTTANNTVTFNPANATGDDQLRLNLFYFNCFIHDFFYLLGFNENAGNFQQSNFGRGGTASDRVDAIVHPGAVSGTANMHTPIDGSSPTMNMGLFVGNPANPVNRHTALDSSVVFHEFTHGVTNRLVGGPTNVSALDEPQSGAMGEGWGDYIACTINNTTVVGSWVVNLAQGIRHNRYNSNFPHNFGHLGTTVVITPTHSIDYTEVHNIGEIWCATLMEMGRRIGRSRTLQLVVDALILSPTNPSFLDMRDSILRALYYKLFSLRGAIPWTVWQRIWSVFSQFGMGPAARSNGADLTGIVADFMKPTGISINDILARNNLTRPLNIRNLAQSRGFNLPVSIHTLVLHLLR